MAPRPKFERLSPAFSRIDGDFGSGHYIGAVAADHATELASTTGIGLVAVRDSTHFGACAYYGARIARSGMLGLVFTNADALIKHPNSTDRFFGTNPVCLVAGLGDGELLTIDMATSIVSFNKITNHIRSKTNIPDEWGFDRDGHPVRVPSEVYSLAPFGGYKGFWLAMVVEILTSVLAGGTLGKDVIGMYGEEPMSHRRPISHSFMALDLARNSPEFTERLKYMLESMRRLSPMEGHTILVADDLEKIAFKSRSVSGIPVDSGLWKEFLAISPEFGETKLI